MGISGPSFSHYYYMVCMSWALEEGRGAGSRERLTQESALWWGVVSALGMCSEEGTTLAQILSRGQIMSVSREPRTALTLSLIHI